MRLVEELPLQAFNLNDFSEFDEVDVEETGSTFHQNAKLKAEFFANKTGLLTVADDSGLEVEALEGFPGVASKRWLSGTDQERSLALLKKLESQSNWQARFVSVLCLHDPQQKTEKYFEGEVQGRIAKEIRGEQGFGYDPVFIPEGYDKTFGELSVNVKNQLSHRARAFAKLKKYLREELVSTKP